MNKKFNLLYITLFVSIISLPMLVNWLGLEAQTENLENRKKAEMPIFSFKNFNNSTGSQKLLGLYRDVFGFIEKFDGYYKDNFGLRMSYFNLFKWLKTEVFNVAVSPETTIQGKDGWFFLGNKHANVVAQSKGMIRFNEKDLKEIQQSVQKKEQYFQAKNIQFYIAIPPNKLTVYGEFVPIKQADKPTMRQQVLDLFKDNYRIIDLGKYFQVHKQKGIQLYHKTDSHWNDYGAFLGYQAFTEVVKKDFPELQTLSMDDFNLKQINSYDDLTRILGLTIKEPAIAFIFKEPEKAVLQPKQWKVPDGFHMKPDLYEVRFKNPEKPLKLLVFRDSFSDAWMKYLKETFGETVFIWSYGFHEDIIEKEKPDIVLYEIVERHIAAMK